MTDIEIWKTAVYDGEIYEGLYKVSNWGRILSLNYRNTGKPGLMTPFDTGCGYLQVQLSKNGETKNCFVHRLVATVFLENPDNKPEVNHKDEDKTNNRVENLEWVWHIDNINHGTRNERAGKAISKAMTNGKLSKRVLQLSLDGELIKEWPSTSECGRNGFNQSLVCLCCQGKRKTHKGFRFMYKD